MSVSIAEFTIDYYEKVIPLWKLTKHIEIGLADSREGIERFLQRNPGMSFVAMMDGEVVGVILCGHDGRRGYIHHLAVHYKRRRKGIGRALVNKCLATLRSEGIQNCYLFIVNKNTEGIRFWENTGWTKRSDISTMSITL